MKELRSDDAYLDLANAIIIQAMADYSKYMNVTRPNQRYLFREVDEFFHSSWFGVLTPIDPEVLINLVRNGTFTQKRTGRRKNA